MIIIAISTLHSNNVMIPSMNIIVLFFLQYTYINSNIYTISPASIRQASQRAPHSLGRPRAHKQQGAASSLSTSYSGRPAGRRGRRGAAGPIGRGPRSEVGHEARRRRRSSRQAAGPESSRCLPPSGRGRPLPRAPSSLSTEESSR